MADNGGLHDILWGLPMFPCVAIAETPLASHPADIALAPDDGKV